MMETLFIIPFSFLYALHPQKSRLSDGLVMLLYECVGLLTSINERQSEVSRGHRDTSYDTFIHLPQLD